MNTIATSPPPIARPLRAPADRLVGGVRAAWRRSVLLRALVIAPALFGAAAVLLVLVDLLVPLRAGPREVLRWLPPLLGAGFLAWSIHRVVRPPAPRAFALLAEERIPALGNRLLTVFDAAERVGDGPVGRAFVAEAERTLAAADLRGAAPVQVRAPAIVLASALALAVLFSVAFPSAAAEALNRWLHPANAYESRWREVRAETLPNVTAPAIPAFDELRWRIEPPAYAGLPAQDGRGDDAITALPGSRIRLRSRFPDAWDAVRAAGIGGGALGVRRAGGEWVVDLAMTPDAKGVSLEALVKGEVAARRIVALIPLPDQPPDVQLALPAEDLVLATGAGRLPIRATAADDYGVGDFSLHWTRTRGSGESFEFIEGQWAFARVARNGKTATGELTVDLASLQLQPGDVIHLRAVARDRNTVTGPGESVSRTRIVRVARPEEADQINTDIGMPPELPKDPVMSQRMIIVMTERLRDRAPRMPKPDLMRESNHIATLQGRLREVVGEQIFIRSTGAMQEEGTDFSYLEQQGQPHGHEGEEAGHAEEEKGAEAEKLTPEEILEAASEATGTGRQEEIAHTHDEGPVIDVNRTLVLLYNIMWSSQRMLNVGQPDSALPYQYEALRMIQELNKNERIYPRGNVSVDPINVAEARGTGKMEGVDPAGRGAGPALPSVLPLLASLDRAAANLGRKPAREASLEISNLAARALADPAADREAAALISRASGEAAAGRADRARDLLRRARARLAPSASATARPLPNTSDPAAADYFRRLGRTP